MSTENNKPAGRALRAKKDPVVAYSMNYGGNTHMVVKRINELGWAQYLVSVSSEGFNSVVVFVLPQSVLDAARAAKRVF